MPRPVLVKAITTANDATVTSPPFRMGGRQITAELGQTCTTLIVFGVFNSSNSDTVRFEVGVSASGGYVPVDLDPLSVEDHIDGSGEFAAQGAVNVYTAPGAYGRFVFRAPGGAGDSSISCYVVNAMESSALNVQ